MNSIITELTKTPNDEHSSRQHYVSDLGYAFSHFIYMIIFLADCKRKNDPVIIIDEQSKNQLMKVFPIGAPVLAGYSGFRNMPEGTPDWFLINSIKSGTTKGFTETLIKNNINIHSLDDVSRLIQNNTPFYIFRPSLEMIYTTFQKIRKTDEITFFRIYEQACNTLGIAEENRIISINKIKELSLKDYAANEALIKKAGFHP